MITDTQTPKARGWISYVFAGFLFFAGGFFGIPALQNPTVAIGAGDMIEDKITQAMDDEDEQEAGRDAGGDQ